MDDAFSRRFSREEIAAMRRIAADEDGLGRKLFALLRRAARRIPFAEDAVAAWHCARDPATPSRVRMILMAALAYLVLPIDAIPDLAPLIGFTDDAAVIAAAIAAVAAELKPEHREKARATLACLED